MPHKFLQLVRPRVINFHYRVGTLEDVANGYTNQRSVDGNQNYEDPNETSYGDLYEEEDDMPPVRYDNFFATSQTARLYLLQQMALLGLFPNTYAAA